MSCRKAAQVPRTAAYFEDRIRQARSVYIELLAIDPNDASGRVARVKEIYYALLGAAEAENLAPRVPPAIRDPMGEELGRHGGSVQQFVEDLLSGLLQRRGEEILLDRRDEDAVLKWAAREAVDAHMAAGRQALIDHLSSIIPREAGETYLDYRARLSRRRYTWRPGLAERMIDAEMLSRTASARPRSAERPSPATSRKRPGPTGRSPGTRSAT